MPLVKRGGGSYTLPPASAEVLGGIKVGEGLSIDEGVLSAEGGDYELPVASADTLGGVKVGIGLEIEEGVLSATGALPEIVPGDAGKLVAVKGDESGHEHVSPYALPTASPDILGGVKVAAPVTVTEGVLGISAATTSAAGLMSASDKTKLDGLLPIWTSAGNVTTTSTTGFSVTDNAANQAIYAPGRPLKVGSTYQIVASYTTGAVVLTGATLTDATEYAVEYGDFTRLQKIDVNLPGAFAAEATTTAIKTLTGDPLYWDAGPAELVAVKQLIQSEDSAATTTQPAINVSIDGTDALASDSETATTRTTVGCGLLAEYGDAIEVEVVKATGGTPADDALDLSVSLLFVVK